MRELPAIGELASYAFFFDFDGTLVDIAAKPELARMEPATVRLVLSLRERVGGALAIISGRDVPSVDAFFRPHLLPVAGVHGLHRRDALGRMHEARDGHGFDTRIGLEVEARLGGVPGILIERKAGAIAIHYRTAPEAVGLCRAVAFSIAEVHPEAEVLEGKKVFELKPKSHNKGTAIREFMTEAPFTGRKPVFIGDDITDEDGFRAVNEIGGLAIKVGSGETAAPFRVTTVAAVAAWLAVLSAPERRGSHGQSGSGGHR